MWVLKFHWQRDHKIFCSEDMMEDPTPCGGIFHFHFHFIFHFHFLLRRHDGGPNTLRGDLPLSKRNGVPRGVGGASVGNHLLRQLRPSHAHRLPVHHPWGMDWHALLGGFHNLNQYSFLDVCISTDFSRSTTLKGTPGSSSILCPWSFSVPSLLWISFSVSSAGKNLIFYLSPFSIFHLSPESSRKRRRRLSPEEISSVYARSSKWRRTFKDMWTGSLKRRSSRHMRKQMLSRYNTVFFFGEKWYVVDIYIYKCRILDSRINIGINIGLDNYACR